MLGKFLGGFLCGMSLMRKNDPTWKGDLRIELKNEPSCRIPLLPAFRYFLATIDPTFHVIPSQPGSPTVCLLIVVNSVEVG